MKHITERIKAFVEKWQHRLHGDMLMTVKSPSGHTTSHWIRDIYTDENGAFIVDFCNPDDDPELIGQKRTFLDFTITGA